MANIKFYRYNLAKYIATQSSNAVDPNEIYFITDISDSTRRIVMGEKNYGKSFCR